MYSAEQSSPNPGNTPEEPRHSTIYVRSPTFRLRHQLGLHHIQARQQEARTEISPVYTAVDHDSRSLDTARRQSISQFCVSPTERDHTALHQQARFLAPVQHGLRFCWHRRLCTRQHYWPAPLTHPFTFRCLAKPTPAQLESFLTEPQCHCLHYIMDIVEARSA